ncbi:hypothetical protein MPSEU_000523100 [Mayamaea pseudoterrestris]|nr:hypothetical protein MPSEU_000523100 [Mayamaea pseudoterrestris]
MFSYPLRQTAATKAGDQQRPRILWERGRLVQAAIEFDLVQLRDEYELKLIAKEDEIKSDVPFTRRSKYHTGGFAFRILKDVFGVSKLNLLHTLLAPKRSDRSAFSQLLYNACWSLLKDSLRDDDSVNMMHASFAVFTLYILYETNPLPSGVATTDANRLVMLPMGLNQNLENPGFLHRRHFKQAIRVGLRQYYMIQRLRQHALAGMASQATLSASYAVLATDVIYAIDRLLPKLQLCSKSGPCGLESSAGDEIFVKSHGQPQNVANGVAFAPSIYETECMDVDSPRGSTPSTAFELVQETFSSYLQGCHSIRFPSVLSCNTSLPTRMERMRETLHPVTDGRSNDIPFDRFSSETDKDVDALKHVPLRSVTFGVVPAGVDIGPLATTKSQLSLSIDRNFDSAFAQRDYDRIEFPSLDLVLPQELLCFQERSLMAAIETLLSRRKGTTFLASTQSATSNGILTIGSEATSKAGRNALKCLMEMATISKQQSTMANLFFDTEQQSEPPLRNMLHSQWDETDDLSDVSLDDELSVAASAVGRNALSNLLCKSARNTTGTLPSRKLSGNGDDGAASSVENFRVNSNTAISAAFDRDCVTKSTVASAVGRNTLDQLLSTSSTSTRGCLELDDDSSRNDVRDEENTSAAASAVGWNALTHLLDASKSDTRTKVDDATTSFIPIDDVVVGQRPKKRRFQSLSHDNQSDDESTYGCDPSHASESEPAGRHALAALLYRANKKSW